MVPFENGMNSLIICLHEYTKVFKNIFRYFFRFFLNLLTGLNFSTQYVENTVHMHYTGPQKGIELY